MAETDAQGVGIIALNIERPVKNAAKQAVRDVDRVRLMANALGVHQRPGGRAAARD